MFIAINPEGFFMNENNRISFDRHEFPTRELAQFACDHSPVRGFEVQEVEIEEEHFDEHDYNDAPTQEEVESCRDWGCPYDTSEGALPFQLQEDLLFQQGF